MPKALFYCQGSICCARLSPVTARFTVKLEMMYLEIVFAKYIITFYKASSQENVLKSGYNLVTKNLNCMYENSVTTLFYFLSCIQYM